MIDDEWLDLVDDDDNVISKMLKSEVHAQGLKNFRGANLFIKNSKGQLWIPRRQPHKKIFPYALDFSVGGHVSSGETYEEALHREAWEELRLDLSKVKYTFLGKGHPKDGFFCFQKIYELISDDVPDFDRNDFCGYYWLTPQELIYRIETGDKAKQDVPVFVKRFYLK